MNAARIDPAEEHIKPAPKALAMLAVEMRGWAYDDIRAALIACSEAGWTTGRIYREVFALLMREDGVPADLRNAARNPLRSLEPRGSGRPEDPKVVSAIEQAKRASDAATARFQAQARGTQPARDDGPKDAA